MRSPQNLPSRNLQIAVFAIWVVAFVLLLSVGTAIWQLWPNTGDAHIFTPFPSTKTPPATALTTTTPDETPVPGETAIFDQLSQPSKTPPPSDTPQPSPTLNFPTRTRNPSATPHAARPVTIGTSVNGRPLEIYSFGNGLRKYLIVAGIHGGYEWNTIALADELIAYLGVHPEMIPTDIQLYILRAFNPDGEARSHSYDGRANTNGVDLNRNFPVQWQAEWPRSGCWDYGQITAGAYPASEPETIALVRFIQTRNIEALISYHSAALGIFPGGQPPDPASTRLAESVATVSNYPYPPIDTGCLFSGQLIDWASAEGIAAVDIELSNHTETEFKQNLWIVKTFLTWKP